MGARSDAFGAHRKCSDQAKTGRAQRGHERKWAMDIWKTRTASLGLALDGHSSRNATPSKELITGAQKDTVGAGGQGDWASQDPAKTMKMRALALGIGGRLTFQGCA